MFVNDYRNRGFNRLVENEFLKHFNDDERENYNVDNNFLRDKCEVIHVGIVCAGFKSNLQLHTMLKSLFFHTDNDLHFHIIANKQSENVLQTLFNTWDVDKVNVSFYDINKYIDDVRWVPNTHYSGVFGLLKLLFPKIISSKITDKLIVLDTDLLFVSDIFELWSLFKEFKYKQAVGLVENESDYYLEKSSWPAIGKGFNSGLVLYHLEKLKTFNWPALWTKITKKVANELGSTQLGDQDVINAVIKDNPNILYEVPCYWNTQLSDHTNSYLCYRKNKFKIIHWNSPKKTNVLNKDGDYFRALYTFFADLNGNLLQKRLYLCNNTRRVPLNSGPDVCYEFTKIKTTKWRTLLFFREFKYKPTENDVTFTAQLSFDRIQMIEELAKYWDGPMSLTLYITDPEVQECNNFISNSKMLQDRMNIAYHIVFKDGEYYPINLLRNVALRNVNTPYVFLADIDFISMKDLYYIIKNQIRTIKNLDKKALIVPAFETQRYKSRIPKNKQQLLKMLDIKEIFPFRHDVWAAGHSPTNYTKWRTSFTMYKVDWQPDFEPYIVVKSDVVSYDQSFMGFGWNKVSHIMELNAQGYEFFVLPNCFIMHKAHAPSFDIARFRISPIYRMCLQNLKDKFIIKLNKKYGTSFSSKFGKDDSITNYD